MPAAFMKSAQALLVIALLLCARAVAQTAPSANQRSSAQVHGTMTDPTGAAFANMNVTFQGDAQKQTVTTNAAGEYRAELLPGLYTLDVSAAGFRRYHRPFFSVTSQSNLTFDVTMQLTSSCDFVLVNNSGEPVTAEQQKAAPEEMCIREELLPVQSKKGPAFSLFVHTENEPCRVAFTTTAKPNLLWIQSSWLTTCSHWKRIMFRMTNGPKF